jgi:hypothetical protein
MPDYQYNRRFAKSGEYQTPLSAENEKRFNNWLSVHSKHPAISEYDPQSKQMDYDLRGWWLNNNGIAPPQGHFPDTYKTPYHETFSNESIYALPTAPRWIQQGQNWFLLGNDGSILKQE